MIKDIIIFIISFGATIILSLFLLVPLWDYDQQLNQEMLDECPDTALCTRQPILSMFAIILPIIIFFLIWTFFQWYFTRYED